MRREVVVVGGGLAGAAAAVRLAAAGRDVLLLERTRGAHDKVCGEFLSFEAVEELRSLGLDPAALGAAPIRSVAAHHGRAAATATLPFTAWSLSRRALDEALLARAASAGAEVRRGARATGLARDRDGWVVSLGAERLAAAHAILATGKHDLRGWPRPPGRQPGLVGLKSYWRLADPASLAGRVELHLFPGGYAGLELVEGGRANLCLVVRAPLLARLGGWPGLLAHVQAASPALAGTLEGAVASAERPLAIAGLPYGLVAAPEPGLWRLGDQAAVIPSFTGEGMSLALVGARRAAAALLAGTAPEAHQAALARGVRGQVARATWASRALLTPWGRLAAPRLAPLAIRGLVWSTRIPSGARGAPRPT